MFTEVLYWTDHFCAGVKMLVMGVILLYSSRISSSSDCYELVSMNKKIKNVYSHDDSDYEGQYEDPAPFLQVYDEVGSIQFTCHGVELPILPVVRNHSCSHCPQSLVIKHSNLSIVPSASFADFSFLTSISMENQHIEELIHAAFDSLQSLQHINLAGNKITKIRDGIFNSLYNLRSLDLSRNKISVLEEHSLSGLVELQLLNVSHNNLIYFGDSILHSDLILHILDLSFNNISRFDSLSIHVAEINLTSNVIDTMNFCPILGLSKLNLSKNRIRSLRNDKCSHEFFQIQDLDLSYNGLNELGSVSFFNSGNSLRRLYMNNNNISIIPVGFFSNLYDLLYLNLSCNRIEDFRHGTFEALGELNILDISHNNLKDMRWFLHSLSNLRQLYMNQNEIGFIDSKQLVDYLPNLSKISIADNNLTCENLIDLTHELKRQNINFEYGFTKNTSNIQGIACFQNKNYVGLLDTIHSEFEKIIVNKLDRVVNNPAFKKSAMYAYINDDFKNSNFYKYMENMQKLNSFKFNETQMIKYFESLKNMTNFVNDFSNSVNKYFNSEFKKSNYFKYMDGLEKADDMMNDGFMKSVMYNFFNKDFEKSNFYKYLESLRKTPQNLIYTSDNDLTGYEKLIQQPLVSESYSDRIVPLMILIILIIICINTLLSTYLKWNNSNKPFDESHRREYSQMGIIDA